MGLRPGSMPSKWLLKSLEVCHIQPRRETIEAQDLSISTFEGAEADAYRDRGPAEVFEAVLRSFRASNVVERSRLRGSLDAKDKRGSR